MYAYVVRRLIIGVAILVAMSFVTFLLFFASPVDPGRFACGKSCSPEKIKQTDKAFGYDKNWTVQWSDFMVGLVKGRDYPEDKSLREAAPDLVSHCPAPCLGSSVVASQNVTDELKQAAPISISVAITAFVIWIAGGVSIGALAAVKKGTIIDRGAVGMSLFFYALPTFWTGTFLISFTWSIVQL